MLSNSIVEAYYRYSAPPPNLKLCLESITCRRYKYIFMSLFTYYVYLINKQIIQQHNKQSLFCCMIQDGSSHQNVFNQSETRFEKYANLGQADAKLIRHPISVQENDLIMNENLGEGRK